MIHAIAQIEVIFYTGYFCKMLKMFMNLLELIPDTLDYINKFKRYFDECQVNIALLQI